MWRASDLRSLRLIPMFYLNILIGELLYHNVMLLIQVFYPQLLKVQPRQWQRKCVILAATCINVPYVKAISLKVLSINTAPSFLESLLFTSSMSSGIALQNSRLSSSMGVLAISGLSNFAFVTDHSSMVLSNSIDILWDTLPSTSMKHETGLGTLYYGFYRLEIDLRYLFGTKPSRNGWEAWHNIHQCSIAATLHARYRAKTL